MPIPTRVLLPALLFLTALPPALAGDGDLALRPPSLHFSEQPEPAEPSAADPIISRGDPRAYGAENSQWLTFSAGVAHDFSDADDFNLRAAWSQFLIEDVEFMFEGNLWYFDQRGDNAFGINPAFAFRWHFVHEPRFTAYTELGIGLLFATSAVPEGGTDVDFMPRAGIGLTYQISPTDPTRLDVGLRWHHISNARITGDGKNPSRDAPFFFAGIVIPF